MYMNDRHTDVSINSIVNATYLQKNEGDFIESIMFTTNRLYKTEIGYKHDFSLYIKDGKIRTLVIPF